MALDSSNRALIFISELFIGLFTFGIFPPNINRIYFILKGKCFIARRAMITLDIILNAIFTDVFTLAMNTNFLVI